MFLASQGCAQIFVIGAIIMPPFEVMAVDEWHDNVPNVLIMVYLCILILNFKL